MNDVSEADMSMNLLRNNLSPRSYMHSVRFQPHSIFQVDDNVDRRLSGLLRTKYISAIAKELDDFCDDLAYPLDSYTLTKFLHDRGLNMRYLGSLVHVVKFPSSKALLVVEAVALRGRDTPHFALHSRNFISLFCRLSEIFLRFRETSL